MNPLRSVLVFPSLPVRLVGQPRPWSLPKRSQADLRTSIGSFQNLMRNVTSSMLMIAEREDNKNHQWVQGVAFFFLITVQNLTFSTSFVKQVYIPSQLTPFMGMTKSLADLNEERGLNIQKEDEEKAFCILTLCEYWWLIFKRQENHWWWKCLLSITNIVLCHLYNDLTPCYLIF